MSKQGTTPALGLLERRVQSVLEVADLHATGVRIDDLSALLPPWAPSTHLEVTDWLRRHPDRGSVVDGVAFRTPLPPDATQTLERRSRAAEYLSAAESLLRDTLEDSLSLLRCIGVTGSVAYGEPKPGDDCDFLAVTETGSLWVFLAYAFSRMRTKGEVNRRVDPPVWCFNYVLEDRAALSEFARPRGFLFAREALTIRILRGLEFYRGVLASAEWLQVEAPRLFALWSQGGLPSPPKSRRARADVRALNLLLFPVVASYLHAVALLRNHRLRRAGREDELFRIVTRLDRFIVESRKFDRLASIYAPPPSATPG